MGKNHILTNLSGILSIFCELIAYLCKKVKKIKSALKILAASKVHVSTVIFWGKFIFWQLVAKNHEFYHL